MSSKFLSNDILIYTPPTRASPGPMPSPAHSLPKYDGIKYMGIQTIGLTLALFFVSFPMWGSMLTGPKEGAQEEDYYLKEWSAEEVAEGLHQGSMAFAMESRCD
jgi:hypothetical protein